MSPAILVGRLFQRTIMPPKCTSISDHDFQQLNWDDELPSDCLEQWENYKESLVSADGFSISRCYQSSNSGAIIDVQIHDFSDASLEATGFVIYLRTICDNDVYVSLVAAGSKVVPRSAITIPRLELCAALDVSVAARDMSNFGWEARQRLTLYRFYGGSLLS